MAYHRIPDSVYKSIKRIIAASREVFDSDNDVQDTVKCMHTLEAELSKHDNILEYHNLRL